MRFSRLSTCERISIRFERCIEVVVVECQQVRRVWINFALLRYANHMAQYSELTRAVNIAATMSLRSLMRLSVTSEIVHIQSLKSSFTSATARLALHVNAHTQTQAHTQNVDAGGGVHLKCEAAAVGIRLCHTDATDSAELNFALLC
jgi:hypothetical protein